MGVDEFTINKKSKIAEKACGLESPLAYVETLTFYFRLVETADTM
jgi:hypothetical protein